MKMPPSNSRGYQVLIELCKAPATVRQGAERHGGLGLTLCGLRQLYDKLELNNCLQLSGVVYSVAPDAQALLSNSTVLPPARACAGGTAVEQASPPAPTAPAYHGNWQTAPALNSASARRLGYALNTRGPRA